MPTIPWYDRFANRSAAISIPKLLKPNLLITAWSFGSRNNLGFGFPGCGLGVIAPTSMNPKPHLSRASTASAFLSNPAANPTGLSSFKPQIEVFKFSKTNVSRFAGNPKFNALIAKLWANSGSENRNNFKPAFSKKLIIRYPGIYAFHPFLVSRFEMLYLLSIIDDKDAGISPLLLIFPTLDRVSKYLHHMKQGSNHFHL